MIDIIPKEQTLLKDLLEDFLNSLRNQFLKNSNAIWTHEPPKATGKGKVIIQSSPKLTSIKTSNNQTKTKKKYKEQREQAKSNWKLGELTET